MLQGVSSHLQATKKERQAQGSSNPESCQCGGQGVRRWTYVSWMDLFCVRNHFIYDSSLHVPTFRVGKMKNK